MYCTCKHKRNDRPLATWHTIRHEYTPTGCSIVECIRCGCRWIARADYKNEIPNHDKQRRIWNNASIAADMKHAREWNMQTIWRAKISRKITERSETPKPKTYKTMEPKTKKSDFNLAKVKKKVLGLDVEYTCNELSGNSTFLNKYKVENMQEVHNDLRNLFKELRQIMAEIFFGQSIMKHLHGNDFQITEKQEAIVSELMNELRCKFEIRGISISGEGDSRGVVITSVFETANGLKSCINSPRIKLAQDSYGVEEELASIVDDIDSEVYEYLFNGKQAQLSLFGDEEPV